MTPTNEQCAWLAGLYEGEGTAELRMQGRFGPYPSLSIKMSDLDVLEQIQEWFGGNVNGPYQKKELRVDGSLRLTQWNWTVAKCEDVVRIIPLIRPWVKSRSGQRLDELLPVAQARMEGKLEKNKH